MDAPARETQVAARAGQAPTPRVIEVASPSLGSSSRDHEVTVELGGRRCHIRRTGTDGDFAALVAAYRELDGAVDAIGMGGIDLYLVARGRRYVIRDARRLVAQAPSTPVLDGSGLKETLERRAVEMMGEAGIDLVGRRVLMTSAVDRFGMAEALHEAGAHITFGDLIFGLGIPIPMRSWRTFNVVATILLPIVTKLPFQMLYPTGSEQDKPPKPGRTRYYEEADVIAGDYLYVRRYMPGDMRGKWVITNTTTAADVEDLRARGVELLVTTTPVFEGRSFGTNVMEALLVAFANAEAAEKGEERRISLTREEYEAALDALGLEPTVRWLQAGGAARPAAPTSGDGS